MFACQLPFLFDDSLFSRASLGWLAGWLVGWFAGFLRSSCRLHVIWLFSHTHPPVHLCLNTTCFVCVHVCVHVRVHVRVRAVWPVRALAPMQECGDCRGSQEQPLVRMPPLIAPPLIHAHHDAVALVGGYHRFAYTCALAVTPLADMCM